MKTRQEASSAPIWDRLESCNQFLLKRAPKRLAEGGRGVGQDPERAHPMRSGTPREAAAVAPTQTAAPLHLFRELQRMQGVIDDRCVLCNQNKTTTRTLTTTRTSTTTTHTTMVLGCFPLLGVPLVQRQRFLSRGFIVAVLHIAASQYFQSRTTSSRLRRCTWSAASLMAATPKRDLDISLSMPFISTVDGIHGPRVWVSFCHCSRSPTLAHTDSNAPCVGNQSASFEHNVPSRIQHVTIWLSRSFPTLTLLVHELRVRAAKVSKQGRSLM